MLKWKTFIKGQGLDEELLSFADRRIPKTTPAPPSFNFDGNKAREIYEEIISEPSSAAPTPVTTPKPRKPKSKPAPKPKLTLAQLMRFCEADDEENLSAQIDLKTFDLNSSDEFGWTLLMCAACAGSPNCVKWLLSVGSDWTLADKTGNTALRLAQKKRKEEVCDIITAWTRSQSKSEEESSDEGDKRSDSTSETNFCQSCNSNYTSERIHVKSIGHLVSTSKQGGKDKVHFGIPESNVGFQLMLKTGWDRQGLGTEGQGQKFPVKTVLKRDRKGLGNAQDRKAARITHFAPFDTAAVANPYAKQRLERAQTLKKKEDLRIRSKAKIKETEYRRELGSI